MLQIAQVDQGLGWVSGVMVGAPRRSRWSMADFLDETVREMQARVTELASLIDEYERLRVALAALDSLNEEAAPARPRRARDAAQAKAQPAQRRPRGANREAILTVVGERAGVTAAEIAQATGIDKNVVYTTLGKLVRGGAGEPFELASGRKGPRLPAAQPEPDQGQTATEADPAV